MERKDILVLRNDRLGDTILTLPVVAALKRKHPERKIHFLTSQGVGSLLEFVEGIETVIKSSADNAIECVNTLQNLPIKTAFCLRPTFKNALALRRSKIPMIVGTSRRWFSFLFSKRVNVSRKKSGLHESDLNLLTCGLEPGMQNNEFPKVKIPIRFIESIENRIYPEFEKTDRDYFVIHPGSGGSASEWSTNYFGALADMISAKFGWKCVVTGLEVEKTKCSEVAKNKHLILCGETSLLELSALLSKARLFIGNSSGPLHLAVLMGTQAIGLYPPLRNCQADRWAPFGHYEYTVSPDLPECRKCIQGEFSSCACMEFLTPEDVFNQCQSIIEGKAS